MVNWWSGTWEPNPVKSGVISISTSACSAGSGTWGKSGRPTTAIKCFPHAPGMVRRPDVSFIRRGRLPGDVSPDGWIKIPPDLAVEVVSPNDVVEELEEKLEDYQKAGIPLVWVIYPKRRKARVFRLDGTDSRLE